MSEDFNPIKIKPWVWTLVKFLAIIGIIIFMMDQCFKDNAKRAADPKYQIEKHFSGYDGSLKVLVQDVKNKMNDPESFEHVETTYYDRADGYLNVKMVFRGKNGFGGTITQNAFCKLNILTGTISGVTVE